jgi:hypothetical protein
MFMPQNGPVFGTEGKLPGCGSSQSTEGVPPASVPPSATAVPESGGAVDPVVGSSPTHEAAARPHAAIEVQAMAKRACRIGGLRESH